jgi:hypothetical protein
VLSPASGLAPGKYARVERERRFLLAGMPHAIPSITARRIIDRYLAGASLRLRHISGPEGDQYKLPRRSPPPIQGLSKA